MLKVREQMMWVYFFIKKRILIHLLGLVKRKRV